MIMIHKYQWYRGSKYLSQHSKPNPLRLSCVQDKSSKSSKSSKTKEKKSKKSKDDKNDKKKECAEWDSNRAHMETSCLSEEEDLPVEELIVAYNYTIEVSDNDNIEATIKDMEARVHETIVNNQLRCDDPIVRRRKLGGIRHSNSRKLLFGKAGGENQLKVVGTDPSPADKPSKTSKYTNMFQCFFRLCKPFLQPTPSLSS